MSVDPVAQTDRPTGFIFDLNEPSRFGSRRAIEYDFNVPSQRDCGSLRQYIRYDESRKFSGPQSGENAPQISRIVSAVMFMFLQTKPAPLVSLSSDRLLRNLSGVRAAGSSWRFRA